jgi:hypothetical protein
VVVAIQPVEFSVVFLFFPFLSGVFVLDLFSPYRRDLFPALRSSTFLILLRWEGVFVFSASSNPHLHWRSSASATLGIPSFCSLAFYLAFAWQFLSLPF